MAPQKAKVQCPKCEKFFFAGEGLNVHVHRYDMKRQSECKSCPGELDCCPDDAWRELIVSDKPVPCKICLKYFDSRGARGAHVGSKHPKTLGTHCKICGDQFDNKNELAMHEESHVLRKVPFCWECAEMDPRFKRVEDTRKNPHWCAGCGTSFEKAEDLEKHETRATGVRKFDFSLWTKKFAQRFGIRGHTKTQRRATKPQKARGKQGS